jgi:hypothetical protein
MHQTGAQPVYICMSDTISKTSSSSNEYKDILPQDTAEDNWNNYKTYPDHMSKSNHLKHLDSLGFEVD